MFSQFQRVGVWDEGIQRDVLQRRNCPMFFSQLLVFPAIFGIPCLIDMPPYVLIMSAETLFPNKVTLADMGGVCASDLHITFWEMQFNPRFRVPWLLWKLKITKCNGKNAHRFYWIFNVHGRPHKGIKTQKSDQNRKFLYLLDKETINLWRIDETKGFELRVVSGEEVTRRIVIIKILFL